MRLAELLSALSLGVDLGFDQPMEHVLRQTVIAIRLADRLGLRGGEVRPILYYTSLLVNVGCHADAHEQAKWFGDDIALKADKYRPRSPQCRRISVRSGQWSGSRADNRRGAGRDLLSPLSPLDIARWIR